MELNNEFEVDRPIDETWAVLTDVERIAPCLPGAQLQEVEGDEYRGVVKVKVGPITAQYKGKATFVERDEAAKRAVLRAEGRDSRGQGNASALITAQLSEISSERTKVNVDTDLTVTGRVAQFGRGVMGEVSEKLLGQFVQNLEARVLSQAEVGSPAAGPASGGAVASAGAPPPGAPTTADAELGPGGAQAASGTTGGSTNGEAEGGVRRIESSTPVEPVDLLEASGGSVAKRLAPVFGVIAVLWVLARMRKGRRRRRRS